MSLDVNTLVGHVSTTLLRLLYINHKDMTKFSAKRSLTTRCSRLVSKKKRKVQKISPKKPLPSVPDIEDFHTRLLGWYDDSCRELPWRQSPRSISKITDRNEFAYRVWVSEVMLQQTQVVKVIDYFNRWMVKWPKVEQLANADLEEVQETWSGLGYYSRASNLHKGAQFLMDSFQGQFPNTISELRKIPGVGPYTSRAIASIGMGLPEAVVDGNVIRVLARLHIIDEDPKKLASYFQDLADQMLNRERSGDYNQAMMELGALICRPVNPQCDICPVQRHCKAYQTSLGGNQVTDYPRTKKKATKEQRLVFVCILHLLSENSDGWYLMLKRPPTGLLAGLWEFPTVPISSISNLSDEGKTEAMNDFLAETCGMHLHSVGEESYRIQHRKSLGEVVHIFSHIRMVLEVEYLALNGHPDEFNSIKSMQHRWVKTSEIDSIGMCTMVKKVFNLHKDVKPQN